MFSFLKSTNVTLLAREVKFDASNLQNPIVIERRQKGLFHLGFEKTSSSGPFISLRGQRQFDCHMRRKKAIQLFASKFVVWLFGWLRHKQNFHCDFFFFSADVNFPASSVV